MSEIVLDPTKLDPDKSGVAMPPPPEIRVVVPWVKGGPWEVVRLNLENQGVAAEYRELQGKDSGYPDLFKELWSAGEPFILVEHDILPYPGALNRLQDCEHPFCGVGYQVRDRIESWLGCTKFEPARLGNCPLPADWTLWQFDVPVQFELGDRGFGKHVHMPPAVHLQDYR